jgi:hypothetical protein
LGSGHFLGLTLTYWKSFLTTVLSEDVRIGPLSVIGLEALGAMPGGGGRSEQYGRKEKQP